MSRAASRTPRTPRPAGALLAVGAAVSGLGLVALLAVQVPLAALALLPAAVLVAHWARTAMASERANAGLASWIACLEAQQTPGGRPGARSPRLLRLVPAEEGVSV